MTWSFKNAPGAKQVLRAAKPGAGVVHAILNITAYTAGVQSTARRSTRRPQRAPGHEEFSRSIWLSITGQLVAPFVGRIQLVVKVAHEFGEGDC